MPHHQPYMYSATAKDDSRFPASAFDPKAITRASWHPKPERKPQTGPLLSFNTHPDAHEVLLPRSRFSTLGAKTKGAIKWIRRLQLFCRLLELNGALGVLVLMILISKVDGTTAWIMRVTSGIAGLHALYAVGHHARSATAKTPGSTAAYQLFASVTDLSIASIYAYGAFSTNRYSDHWATLLKDQDMLKYLIPSVYYMIIAAGSLHLISCFVSVWLAITFQRISDMPPDMNPLESHLTARPSRHRRNMSSVTTFSSETDKRLSMAHNSKYYLTEIDWDSIPDSRTVPFIHTRTDSQNTLVNSDSHLPMSQSQYRDAISDTGSRSLASMASNQRSNPHYSRGSYMQIAVGDASPSLPKHVANDDSINTDTGIGNNSRAPKFTETWRPTGSLIARTNHRNRHMTSAPSSPQARDSQIYAALDQRYDIADDSQSDHDDEEPVDEASQERNRHPNPLRSNPLETPPPPPHSPCPQTLRSDSYGLASSASPWSASKLSAKSASPEISSKERPSQAARSLWANMPDLRPPPPTTNHGFYARSYGELRSATPPVMVGNSRKVSSGNDYHRPAVAAERRRVSGKMIEEGRASGGQFTLGYVR